MQIFKVKELLKKSFRAVISLADYEDIPVPDRFTSTHSELLAMIEDYMNMKAQELPPTTTGTDDIETDIHDENDVIQTLSAFEHPSPSPAPVKESASSAPKLIKAKGGDKTTASPLSDTGNLSVAINSAYEANYKAHVEYLSSCEEDSVVSPLPHSRTGIVATKQDAHREDSLSSPPSSRHKADSSRSHGAPSPPSPLQIVSPGDVPDAPSLSYLEHSTTGTPHVVPEPSNALVPVSEERELAPQFSGVVARRAQPLRRHDTFFNAGWPTFPGEEDLDPTSYSLSPSPFPSSLPLPSEQKIGAPTERRLIIATTNEHPSPGLAATKPETASSSRAPSPGEDRPFLSPSRTDSDGEDVNEVKPESRKAAPAVDPSRRLSRTFALSDESEFEQYDQFQRMQRQARAEPPKPKASKRQREEDDEEIELMAPSPKRIKKEEDHVFESASMLAPVVPGTFVGRIVIPPAPTRRVTRSATRRALAAAAAANPVPPAALVAPERSAPSSSGCNDVTRRGRKAPAKSSSSSKKTKTKRKGKKDN